MVSHHPQSPPQSRHAGRKSVPFKHAFVFGLIMGLVVLVVSATVTEGSSFAEEGFAAVLRLGLPLLYGSIAFVAGTLVAALMNWVVSRKETEDEINRPVLD